MQSTRIESPIFQPRFVGLQNYRDVLGGPYFRDAAGTTLRFALATVPLLMVLGVLVALLLNESFIGNAVLRVGMLLPWALPATVAGLIWKWIFLDSWGALNAGLYATGIIDNYIPWLTTPGLARMAVVVVFIWAQLPLTAIFLLAAAASHSRRALRRRRASMARASLAVSGISRCRASGRCWSSSPSTSC